MAKKSSIALFIAATSAIAITSSVNSGENNMGGLKEWNTDMDVDADFILDSNAKELAKEPNAHSGVLASSIAAEIYGLKILAQNIEDHGHNTTRFLIMSREPNHARRGDGKMMTTIVFQVRNIPAALYKAMGGFATNGVNMLKLESYMLGGSFTATQFYADIEGHPEDQHVKRAFEELKYFSNSLKILGVYPADPYRD